MLLKLGEYGEENLIFLYQTGFHGRVRNLVINKSEGNILLMIVIIRKKINLFNKYLRL